MNVVHESLLPSARWSVLRTIGVGGHLGATETMIYDVLRFEYLVISRQWVRDQLHYLASRGLVEIERSEVHPWRATLSRHGQDLYDYQVDVEPGITRPPRILPDAQ